MLRACGLRVDDKFLRADVRDELLDFYGSSSNSEKTETYVNEPPPSVCVVNLSTL